MKKDASKELTWADDVLAVYEASSKECPKTWSKARRELKEWAELTENRQVFYTNLIPKAIDIIQKFRKDETEDAIVKEERKSIAELKAILADTLASVK